MENCILHPVGKISNHNGEYALVLDKRYAPALQGLDGFGYVQVLWWFDGCDNMESRGKLTEKKPYASGPDTVGVFAYVANRRLRLRLNLNSHVQLKESRCY